MWPERHHAGPRRRASMAAHPWQGARPPQAPSLWRRIRGGGSASVGRRRIHGALPTGSQPSSSRAPRGPRRPRRQPTPRGRLDPLGSEVQCSSAARWDRGRAPAVLAGRVVACLRQSSRGWEALRACGGWM
uniref:Uncharacterized protein n=1 Tax=Arundo donax TaxID=35708 RepID=A0A0A8YD47_ARUDO